MAVNANLILPPTLASNGWTPYTATNVKNIDDTFNNAAIQAEINAHSKTLRFDEGDTWNGIGLVETKSRDWMWGGNANSGRRPKLNIASGSNGLRINVSDNNLTVRLFGLHFDGRETGAAEDDYLLDDRRAITVLMDENYTTGAGSLHLVIEDCVFEYFDTFLFIQDLICRNGGRATGRITGYARRCLFRYCNSRSSHSIPVKPEGLGDGFLFIDCSYDKTGYVDTRDEQDPRGVSYGSNANKREHPIYTASWGAPITVQTNWFTNYAANSAQLRTGGAFDYNVMSQGAMGLGGVAGILSSYVGNLMLDSEDIASGEGRGTGSQLAATRSWTPIKENILYRKGGSLANQRALEISGNAAQHIQNNAAFGWGQLAADANGKGVFYNESTVTEYSGVQGNGYIKVFDDSGWPAVSSGNIDTRHTRARGEWRPAIDHVVSIINPVRALSQAAMQAAGFTTSLPQLIFADNIATSAGPGGLNAAGATNIPPLVSAGNDQVIVQPTTTATLTGTASDPDGSISTHLWEFVSGPATPSITSSSSASTGVTGLTDAGVYIFRYTATDDGGAVTTKTITVALEPVEVTAPPTCSAGADSELYLPQGAVLLFGSDSAASATSRNLSEGDLDGDGDVDDADAAIMFSNWTGPGGSGKTLSDGDLDGDGVAAGGADYRNTIQAAINTASGSYTASAASMRSSPLSLTGTDMDFSIQGTTRLRALPDQPIDPATDGAFIYVESGATGTIAGVNGHGIVDASSQHSGITIKSGSGAITLDRLDVRNAAFKQIRIYRDATVTRCKVSSQVAGTDDAVSRRPMALLVDPGGSNQIGTVTIDDLEIGYFYGSREGQTVKIALAQDVLINNMRTPVPDRATWYSLVMAEGLDRVRVSNSILPRKATHFPDDTAGMDQVVGTLIFSNVTFSNVDLQDHCHDHLKARQVLYYKCRFLNVGTAAINDETAAADLVSRFFVECDFVTSQSSALITHDAGASTLTGKIRHSNCRFLTAGAGVWSKPADWVASEIVLPVGYDIDAIAGLLP